jgi:hypothetical protein
VVETVDEMGITKASKVIAMGVGPKRIMQI